MEITFYDQAWTKELSFAVIAAQYEGKWILCRHRERQSWELPGGHREENESIWAAAQRELWEETGAKEYQLESVSAYCVIDETGQRTYGGLFFAEVEEWGECPAGSEMEENCLFDSLPEQMTYPEIQPALLKCVQDWLDSGGFRSEAENIFEFLY